ncbi:MAG TPA: YIP1 family protein [Steroidobacteraceae bacterium]|nr:YIP1 family protein [Steroidobacteraceae bacterium]
MLPTEPIQPLKDVWLRPRRVFRELAARPVGIVDYLLAAAQGSGNVLALYRTESAGARSSVEEILWRSFAFGAVVGVVSLFLMAVIYGRLGARAGGKSTTSQVIHVLAYGGVPLVAGVALWVLTALIVGEPAFISTPRAGAEPFLVLLLRVQFAVYVLLLLWSILLQVMGLSEIQGLALRKAFGVWILGQLVGYLLSVFLAMLIDALFPGVLLHFIPPH